MIVGLVSQNGNEQRSDNRAPAAVLRLNATDHVDLQRQCCHGVIGTVLIAFAGEPLTIFVLIAR
jgi:hypothetical protein